MADLDGADLTWADMQKAELFRATLRGAKLPLADLSGADLGEADLSGADLSRAKLRGAILDGARVDRARLAFADLTGACYAPASPPPDDYLEGVKGLETVAFPPGQHSGLVQLRKLLADRGLREEERAVTRAIVRTDAWHALRGRMPGKLSRLRGAAWIVLFGWTVDYGRKPGRALRIILAGIALMTLVYIPVVKRDAWLSWFDYGLSFLGPGAIYKELSENQRETSSSEETTQAAGGMQPQRPQAQMLSQPAEAPPPEPQPPPEPPQPQPQPPPEPRQPQPPEPQPQPQTPQVKPSPEHHLLAENRPFYALGWALWFSALSTFQFGFQDLSVGDWLARLQSDEFTLRATGWVRTVSGFQSLLSLYLVAICALSYFGRPFG